MGAILGKHGTEYRATELLDDDIVRITVHDNERITAWKKHIAMTETKQKLPPVIAEVNPEAFAVVFEEANERTSSSSEGLHYTTYVEGSS